MKGGMGDDSNKDNWNMWKVKLDVWIYLLKVQCVGFCEI